ncbi:DUF7673 family protein [Ramlibacter rhizophilus]|uniref:DUF7673 domain-containing protein n=1 Tax=Ramlibacter rhizophilus TaxID=1781167 RepID=A0A4Z0BX28_9BURK|nr:hypothetical protein [Ramlibacter rhizophilus]TFZ03461.1 hypothetical protein EZ242_06195 [Ramlibacter rhizophilus]
MQIAPANVGLKWQASASSRETRERRHRARLAQIQSTQVVCGRGDRARVDTEATLIERACLLADELAAHAATERGLEALSALLRRVEEDPSPRTRDIRVFIEAVWECKPLPLAALRTPCEPAQADMLAVLDAWRHSRCVLAEQVEGGLARVARAVERRR